MYIVVRLLIANAKQELVSYYIEELHDDISFPQA